MIKHVAFMFFLLLSTLGFSAQPKAEMEVQLGHTETITKVAISPDNKYILSGGGKNELLLWDIASGKQMRRFTGHTDIIQSIAFSPKGGFAASGSGYKVKIWDLASGRETKFTASVYPKVSAIKYSPDGKTIL